MFWSLSEWRLLVVICQHIYNDEYNDEHASVAADTFLELVERLRADDNGELLLQPIGHCSEMIDGW